MPPNEQRLNWLERSGTPILLRIEPAWRFVSGWWWLSLNGGKLKVHCGIVRACDGMTGSMRTTDEVFI